MKRAGDKAVVLSVSLTRMAWISLRMTNSWRGPMIECVLLSLAAPCPVRWMSYSGVGGTSSDGGFRKFTAWRDVEITQRGIFMLP